MIKTDVKALEIAITLSRADHKCLFIDDEGHLSMAEPLLSAYKSVLAFIKAEDEIADRLDRKLYPAKPPSSSD